MPHAKSIPKQIPSKHYALLFDKNNISNAELRGRIGMRQISLEVNKRRWKWSGHVNRMPLTSISRAANRQTTMAFLGVCLKFEHARRGLSKVKQVSIIIIIAIMQNY